MNKECSSSSILPRISPSPHASPADHNPYYLTRSLCFQDGVISYHKQRRENRSQVFSKKIWEREYVDPHSFRVNSFCRELNNRSVTLDGTARNEQELRGLERECKKLRSVEPSPRELITNARAMIYDQLSTIDKMNELARNQGRCQQESKSLMMQLESKAKQEIKIKQDRTQIKESIRTLLNRMTDSHKHISDVGNRLQQMKEQRAQLQLTKKQQNINLEQLKVYQQFVLDIFQEIEAMANNNTDKQHAKLFEDPSMLLSLFDFMNENIIFSNKNIQEIIQENIRLEKGQRKLKKKLDRQLKEKQKIVSGMLDRIKKIQDQIQCLKTKQISLNKLSSKSAQTEKQIYERFKNICLEFGEKSYSRMQPLDLLKTLEEGLDERLAMIRFISQTDSSYLQEQETKIILMHRGEKIKESMSQNVSPLLRPLGESNRNSKPHKKRKGRPIISKMFVRKQHRTKSCLDIDEQDTQNDKYFQA